MTISPSAATVFRNYETDGVPSSGNHKPKKADIRTWGTAVETVVNAFTTNGGLIFSTKALMDAQATTYTEPRSAWVYADSTALNNGVYVLNPTTDVWTRIGSLPYDFVIGTDAGAGTANAIQITTDIPVSDGMIVAFSLFEATTASPVTISINSSAALTLKTNRGNDASALSADMEIWGRVRSSDSTFRLLNDQAVTALVGDAEAAAAAAAASANEAAGYAALALDNWVVDGPFTGTGVEADYALTVDPSSANNMIVIVGGVGQMIASSAYSLVYTLGLPYIRINVPSGVSFEVRMGTALAIGTPGDGTVTEIKLTDGAIPAKIHAATEKTAIVDTDEFGITDSAATFALKLFKWSSLKSALWTALGGLIAAGTGKTAPADADTFVISDSAASGASKSLTGTNLKAWLKSYFDTLYGGPTIVTQATTSGTQIDFLSLPAGIKKFTIGLNEVSTSGTDPVLIHLGTSAGIVGTGYSAGQGIITSPSTASYSENTAGFPLPTALAAAGRSGSITFTLMDETNNIWVAHGAVIDVTNDRISNISGVVALPAVLDRVRIWTTGGIDTFDGGSAAVSY